MDVRVGRNCYIIVRQSRCGNASMYFHGNRKRYEVALALLSACFAWFPGVRAEAQQGLRPAPLAMGGFDLSRLDMAMQIEDRNRHQPSLESVSGPVSKLDLKAPGAARREFAKGNQLLMRKKFGDAADHLRKAISIYPSFVAAHNGLGSAYLYLDQSEQAETEFSQAVALDDHLPYSYLNLGWAQLARNNFSRAQESIQKASGLAPLDLNLLTALSYAQLLNHDYRAAITTAHQVHSRKHDDAAIVHYFAAAAWQGQDNLPETRNELQLFLDEAPQSPSADAARQVIEQIKQFEEHPPPAVVIAFNAAPLDPNATTGLPTAAQTVLQQIEQQKQLAEVESVCDTCPETSAPEPLSDGHGRATSLSGAELSGLKISPYTLRSTVNEVAVFFAATDHGKSVTDLSRQDIAVRDAGRPPTMITRFRNQSQLPLRLGLVIDTSNSITKRFVFEQKVAGAFLRQSLKDRNDQAFLVGFSTAVLLVTDFSSDGAKISHGIDQLAPGGGTALWDAVKFASDKLSRVVEEQPVAKILVVISDGEDNSSSVTLKDAIESAERGEVTIYSVSSREVGAEVPSEFLADREMKVLAGRTGGASFFPGSFGNLDRRLSDLQEVIRSRYLISYKPANFEADGSYRSIALVAQKSGHKLRVYARHGYYAPNRADEAPQGQTKVDWPAK
jgi:Ca-activated chloride channel homolog